MRWSRPRAAAADRRSRPYVCANCALHLASGTASVRLCASIIADGLSRTLAAGLAGAPSRWRAALIVLGDMPRGYRDDPRSDRACRERWRCRRCPDLPRSARQPGRLGSGTLAASQRADAATVARAPCSTTSTRPSSRRTTTASCRRRHARTAWRRCGGRLLRRRPDRRARGGFRQHRARRASSRRTPCAVDRDRAGADRTGPRRRRRAKASATAKASLAVGDFRGKLAPDASRAEVGGDPARAEAATARLRAARFGKNAVVDVAEVGEARDHGVDRRGTLAAPSPARTACGRDSGATWPHSSRISRHSEARDRVAPRGSAEGESPAILLTPRSCHTRVRI